MRFDYEVRRSGDNQLLATGHTVHASCGPDGRPIRLPDGLRERLAAREAR